MKMRSAVLLLLTTTIWGVAFVAQNVGMDYVGPLTFNCTRGLVDGVVLLPCIQYFDRKRAKMQQAVPIPGVEETSVTEGVCCGMFLYLVSSFQQFGIRYTTVGRTEFITTRYIIVVPILGLFFKKRYSPVIVGVVTLSVTGLYPLCMTGGGPPMNEGNLLVLVRAAFFTVHIVVIGFFSPVVDGVKMPCIQFFMCDIPSGVGMFLYETPDMGQILAAWAPVLYAGIMSCGVAYTLQVTGQKGADPIVVSLILSLESSISILAGWAIPNQELTVKELTDCILTSATIILIQLPTNKKSAAKIQET